MRVASGRVDAKLAFVAVDSTDLTTRKTGLSAFTVYRSRNGGAATVYTTPTVAELSAANMPGVYVLTIDEDTTITSGVDEEEIALHITCATMAPVTRTFELFRPKITEGSTSVPQTGDSYARLGAPVGASISADIAAVQSDTDNVQTRLPAALVSGRMDSNVGAIGGIADAAVRQQLIATSVPTGVVISGNATSAVIGTSPGATVTDQWKGRELVFDVATATGGLQAARTTIRGNTTGATPTLTFDALPASVALGDLITIQGGDAQTGDSYSRLGAPAGASVSADVAGVQSDTNDLQARTPAALVGGKMDSNVGAVTGLTDAANRLALLATSTPTCLVGVGSNTTTIEVAIASPPHGGTANQFKDRYVVFDIETATVELRGCSRRISASVAGTPPACTLTVAALPIAPQALDTFTIQGGEPTQSGDAYGVANSRLPAALTGAGNMKSDMLALDGSTAAANALEISASAIAIGATALGCTTTTIETLGVTPVPADVDQFKGRILVFASTNSQGEICCKMTAITASTAGATPQLTVDELVTAPEDGQTFVIL